MYHLSEFINNISANNKELLVKQVNNLINHKGYLPAIQSSLSRVLQEYDEELGAADLIVDEEFYTQYIPHRIHKKIIGHTLQDIYNIFTE